MQFVKLSKTVLGKTHFICSKLAKIKIGVTLQESHRNATPVFAGNTPDKLHGKINRTRFADNCDFNLPRILQTILNLLGNLA